MTLQPDQNCGSYRVVRLLGRGGMGDVYEAEDRASGARVALKVYAPEDEAGKTEEAKRRFQVEARLLARLRHPHLVHALGLEQDGHSGLLYFAMDLVLPQPGAPRTLADVVTGDLDERQILKWFAELASVLDYIHAEGVVHRDIKLENVLLDSAGHAVLSDLGISHLCSRELRRDVDAARTLVTEVVSGHRLLMGTAGYLAPEVERGETPTAAADVYALGVLFIYLLSGLWYTPGSKILAVLGEMTYRWDEVLPPMVAAEPSARPTDLTALARLLAVGRFASKFWRRIRHYLSLLVAAVVGGVAVTLVRLVIER